MPERQLLRKLLGVARDPCVTVTGYNPSLRHNKMRLFILCLDTFLIPLVGKLCARQSVKLDSEFFLVSFSRRHVYKKHARTFEFIVLTSKRTDPKNMNDKVIIIGGGLAGLSLGNVLKHQGVPYKVYERDASPEARTQGWSISVHFCLPYLRKSMDPVKYSKLGAASAVDPQHTVDGHKLVVFDGDTGEKIIEPVGGDVEMEVYRVNRGRFRQWLLEGLDVEWDKILDHYEVTESGVKVTFKDGTTETGSVLVGADGVNSAVCAQILGNERFQEVTSVNPLQVFGTAYWMDQATRQSFEAIAPAHMMAFGSHKGNARGLFASLSDIDRSGPEPKYEMQWLVSGLDPLESQPQNDKERLEIAKKWLEDFHPLFRSLINETPADKPILHLTIRERFPSTELAAKSQKGRIVLIGDAAHAMTMYRGEGKYSSEQMNLYSMIY